MDPPRQMCHSEFLQTPQGKAWLQRQLDALNRGLIEEVRKNEASMIAHWTGATKPSTLILRGYVTRDPRSPLPEALERRKEEVSKAWEDLSPVREKYLMINRDLTGSELGYDTLLYDYWNKGYDLIILEEDVVVTPWEVQALLDCGDEYCGYREMGELGCTKISKPAQELLPIASWYALGNWTDLYNRIDGIMRFHFGTVVHAGGRHYHRDGQGPGGGGKHQEHAAQKHRPPLPDYGLPAGEVRSLMHNEIGKFQVLSGHLPSGAELERCKQTSLRIAALRKA